jgi:hypothetical protein
MLITVCHKYKRKPYITNIFPLLTQRTQNHSWFSWWVWTSFWLVSWFCSSWQIWSIGQSHTIWWGFPISWRLLSTTSRSAFCGRWLEGWGGPCAKFSLSKRRGFNLSTCYGLAASMATNGWKCGARVRHRHCETGVAFWGFGGCGWGVLRFEGWVVVCYNWWFEINSRWDLKGLFILEGGIWDVRYIPISDRLFNFQYSDIFA